ncbi:MAG TPA: hypothetical protein VGZ47_03225 [Gemmataceae bacterium]|nr:hypothetical protein [Gemmataceae bacterium]
MGSFSRRQFLATSGLLLGAGFLHADNPHLTPPPRSKPASKKLAVVTTAYHYLSHAYHVCSRFLNGYLRQGNYHYPDFAIAGMYVEQQKANDLSRELSRKHGFALAESVAEALVLGKDTLAIDGVLLIGEHGDYPYNAKLQKLYPRYELFQKIVEVFRKTGKSVPVFCDKHLSYDRTKAAEMAATSRKLGFPLMAGSSLPITWRKPELELPLGVKFEQALVATRGEIEIYGFHGLEALQCMVERRAGAETGVKAVTCLEGDAAWKAGDDGIWSWDLLDEAVSRTPSRNNGDIRENCRQFNPPAGRPTYLKGPIAFVIEYRDGFRATVLIINGHIDDTIFAAKLADQKKPVSTLFFLPPPPGAAFLEALAIRIEDFLSSGKPPFPVERTLLTGGILDCVLESRQKGHMRLETPELEIMYSAPRDSGFMRGDYP